MPSSRGSSRPRDRTCVSYTPAFLWLVPLGEPLREDTRHIANIRGIVGKAREFQKNIYFCFIDYAKDFECVDHNAAAAAKSLESCPTLCDPRDGSLLGSSLPGILQTRTLEWVAISFSSAGEWKVKVKLLSRVWLLTKFLISNDKTKHSSNPIFIVISIVYK